VAALRGSTALLLVTGIAGNTLAASLDDIVTADFQSTRCLADNTAITVTQSGRQCGGQFRATAAAVPAQDVTDFIGGFLANPLIRVVQRVDQGHHNLRITLTVVVTEIVHRTPALPGITGGL